MCHRKTPENKKKCQLPIAKSGGQFLSQKKHMQGALFDADGGCFCLN
jgi:hypothetical protein